MYLSNEYSKCMYLSTVHVLVASCGPAREEYGVSVAGKELVFEEKKMPPGPIFVKKLNCSCLTIIAFSPPMVTDKPFVLKLTTKLPITSNLTTL